MRHLIGSGALLCVLAAPGSAQAVLDWPLLLEARPVPLVTGAGALLGNPAGLARLAARAEGIVSDLETPEEMGLRALTIAGAVRVLDDWVIGATYRHVGVGDMLRTDGPPLGGGTTPMEIAEDVFALGLGARFGLLTAGAGVRLDTPADALGGDEAWAGTVGASIATPIPFAAVEVAAALEVDGIDARFAGAAEIEAPAVLTKRLSLALAYGARETGPLGFSHTVVASGVWNGMFELQAGAAAQPGAAGEDWVPVLAGILHLGRYRLGIVREHLPNDFGAAMHYRLSVDF